MKAKQKLEIAVVGEDYVSNDILYEVKTNNTHYFFSIHRKCSSYNVDDLTAEDISSRYELIERKDLTDKQFEVCKALFDFLWSSDYTNTCMDYEAMVEQYITYEDIEELINTFHLENALDIYGGADGIEIYWDFFEHFDYKHCPLLY